MGNEEKFGQYDVHLKRIEGETVDGQPAFAMATYQADVEGSQELSVFCLIGSGSYNYAISTAMQTKPKGYVGAYFMLDVYAFPASGTLQFFVDIRNPCDGEFSAIMQADAIPGSGTTAGVRKYLLYPDAVDTDSLLTHLTQLPCPQQWRTRVLTGGGSGTWSYSLGVQYVE